MAKPCLSFALSLSLSLFVRFYITLSGQKLTGREATRAAEEDQRAVKEGLGPAAKDRSTIMRWVTQYAYIRSSGSVWHLSCEVLMDLGLALARCCDDFGLGNVKRLKVALGFQAVGRAERAVWSRS